MQEGWWWVRGEPDKNFRTLPVLGMLDGLSTLPSVATECMLYENTSVVVPTWPTATDITRVRAEPTPDADFETAALSLNHTVSSDRESASLMVKDES